MSAGRLDGATIFTPFFTTTWSAALKAQLPPCFTARSMMTEPGFMAAIVSPVTSRGTGRGLYARDRLLGHEPRCGAARDERGGDDDVRRLRALLNQRGLALLVVV